MDYVIKDVIVKQPRIKADKTGTIGGGTLLELSEEDFKILNNMSWESQTVKMVLVESSNYVDFIIQEAARIAKQLEE